MFYIRCYVALNDMVRKTIEIVLNILEENQDGYIDPAEHIYDAVKTIKRHLDDEDLILYVGDFILGLKSDANGDFDGTLKKCVKMIVDITSYNAT